MPDLKKFIKELGKSMRMNVLHFGESGRSQKMHAVFWVGQTVFDLSHSPVSQEAKSKVTAHWGTAMPLPSLRQWQQETPSRGTDVPGHFVQSELLVLPINHNHWIRDVRRYYCILPSLYLPNPALTLPP